MPRPSPNAYPKEARWRFLQRQMTDADLVTFSQAIVACDGMPIDACASTLVGFMGSSRTSQTALHDLWLAIPVNMMQQQGLGFTYNEGKFIQATDLARFVKETGRLDAYWYYWALRFQYPFGFPKHNHYILNGVAVQPAVLVLQHLQELHHQSGGFRDAFLSQDEIVKYLMAAKDHSGVVSNSRTILGNRTAGQTYSTERRNPDFVEAGGHFFSRGRLFLGKFDLLDFQGDRVVLRDLAHLEKVQRFLSRARPPIKFAENSMDMRNLYSATVYDDLNPDPIELFDFTTGTVIAPPGPSAASPSSVRAPAGGFAPPSPPWPPPGPVNNPASTRGTFATRSTQTRTFQSAMREDLLELYDRKCSVCGLDREDLLITSHIVPVRVDPLIAADRRNALMLCVLHDKALEEGYFGVDSAFRVVVNPQVLGATHPLLVSEIIARNGNPIRLPAVRPGAQDLRPLPDFLDRHRRMHGIS
jgi:hypothetical protein